MGQFRTYIKNRTWGWFIIIAKTRPLIGVSNPEEELRLLEEKAKAAYGAYLEQVETKKKLEEENGLLADEITQLKTRLNNEPGDMTVYMEKQAKLSTQIADLEEQLKENNEKIAEEERLKEMVENDKKGADKE